ncbi:hypothetical protein NLJ89_g7206 [Agrocybe chaxingu]|uniref:Flap endonuclease 1 n=1 Tax=Agrocybe chaxingu TaxID=84603 RepID=A0A9W8JXS6_9AGAR|nr:hypothetical protein NLJ89_g7206 [Agrocybe chaxingu]
MVYAEETQFVELCILLGCDYLEPIKGVGPKSALKLLKEHGSLKAVLKHLRAKSASKKAAAESDEEASEHEEHAPTSDVEMDSDADDRSPEEKQAEAEKKEEKEKAAQKAAAKAKRKGKGGIQVPEEWPWEDAKKIFEKPDVLPADEIELEWKNPDVDGLVQFLVTEKGFNEERVRKGAEKLQKFLNMKQQGRLDGFFTAKPKEKAPAPAKGKAAGAKGGKGTKRKGDDKEASSSKKSKKK